MQYSAVHCSKHTVNSSRKRKFISSNTVCWRPYSVVFIAAKLANVSEISTDLSCALICTDHTVHQVIMQLWGIQRQSGQRFIVSYTLDCGQNAALISCGFPRFPSSSRDFINRTFWALRTKPKPKPWFPFFRFHSSFFLFQSLSIWLGFFHKNRMKFPSILVYWLPRTSNISQ